MTFRPRHALSADTEYTVQINAAARSADGERLGRHFRWTFRTADAASDAATGVLLTATAAPTKGGGAQITVSLSSPASVSATVCNTAGRVVAMLPERDLTKGMNALLWDCRSRRGTPVPPGLYLVRVRALQRDGARAQCIAPLRLR